MSFNEKLQTLRKQKKLSQEQLADMLDVTRQSVSKWESGTTYPEMDKLIMLCKIFKCSLDDLTNDEITDLNISGKREGPQNNFLRGILDILTKTVYMFKAMNFKQIICCIVSMFILALILLIFKIPFSLVEEGFRDVIYSLLTNIRAQKIVMGLFCFILDIIYYALYILVYVYIYKIAFLDKYEFAENIDKKMIITNDTDIVSEMQNPAKEVIITSKEPHENSLFKLLGTLALGFIKLLTILFSFPIVFILMVLFFFIVITVYFMTEGIFFLGVLLGLIFAVVLVIWFLVLVSSFIFNKKLSFKRMLLVFLISLIGLGISGGITVLEISRLDYKSDVFIDAEEKNVTFEKSMSDSLYIDMYNHYGDLFYEENESLDNVLIEIHYFGKMYKIDLLESKDVIDFNIFYSDDFDRIKFMFKTFKDGLKKHEIYDLDKILRYDITIKASSENINKIKQNTKKYWDSIREKEREDRCLSYEASILDYENSYNELLEENEYLKERIDLLEEKIREKE